MWPAYQPDPLDQLIEQIVEDVRGLVRNDNRSYSELAGDAKLATNTVQRLASGATRRPQLRTLLRLAAVLPHGWRALGQRLNCLDDTAAALRGTVEEQNVLRLHHAR